MQEAQVHCVRHNSLLPVSAHRCAGQEKPYEFLVPKTCSTRPCPAEWVTADWSGCSVTCGTGTQTREQSCRQEISTALSVRVADGACLAAKPEVTTMRTCVQPPCPHHHHLHHHHGHHHVVHPRPPPPPQRDLLAAPTSPPTAPAASWTAGPWGQVGATLLLPELPVLPVPLSDLGNDGRPLLAVLVGVRPRRAHPGGDVPRRRVLSRGAAPVAGGV